ncbi:MAG TPA: DUF5777 family beta-barrel protein [Blastocatellia bacterium]|nr:DUF5777 family beta-barrel protein [Blastocatellia bacterium]
MKRARLLFGFFAAFITVCAFGPTGARGEGVAQAVTEIKVTAKKFAFEPKKITVREGDRVRLVVTSVDVDHGIAIEGLGIDQAVKARQTREIEFTAPRAGRYRISCSVFCGEGHPNMDGELIVTDALAAGTDGNANGLSLSGIQVRFVEGEPGVVYVESGGERIRIDTSSKTVSRAESPAPSISTSSSDPGKPAAALEEQEARRESEPYDYRLVNVPTPKRVPRHSVNVHFTHRFSTPVRQDDVPIKDEAEELFGLDGFSVSSFGLSYGITDRLYAVAYRSPVCQPGLCKTIEVGLGYHLLDEVGHFPIALSAYASIEGDDNFTENFTYNIQAMIARSVTGYVNLFFSPAVHINSNGQGRFNPRSEDFFPPSPVADRFHLGAHTGSFGLGVSTRIRPTTSLIFEYTPRVGFKQGRVTPLFSPDFSEVTGFENKSEAEIGFGIEKRIGRHSFALTFSNTQGTTTSRYNSSNLALPPSRFTIGFNLFRRLY